MPKCCVYTSSTHTIIFLIRMFCNLIRTCSLSSLLTKIDWINLDRRRSEKEVSDKKTSNLFSNSNVLKQSWHDCIAQFCVTIWCFVFFVQFLLQHWNYTRITSGKNMDITKYFEKVKWEAGLLCTKLFCSMLFHFFSSLSCKRDKQCARGTRLQKKKNVLPEKVKKDMAYYARKHGNREQKLGDGLQKSTQITALKQKLLEIGRENIRKHLKVMKKEIFLLYLVKEHRPRWVMN